MITLNGTQTILDSLKPAIKRVREKASTKDKKLLEKHVDGLETLIKKSHKLFIGRLLAFLLLYVSVVSSVFGDLFLISQTLEFATAISGVLGGITLIIILALLQRLITLTTIQAQLHASYITGLDLKYL